MKLLCRIGGHRRVSGAVYNSGFFFGSCDRCGSDLIRTGYGAWENVPAGHAVVWRSGRHSHSLPADFSGVLPIPLQGNQLPATRGGYLSWSRDLAAKAKRRGGAAAAETAGSRDEVEEKPYPRLVVMALMVGASLQLLLTLRRPRTANSRLPSNLC